MAALMVVMAVIALCGCTKSYAAPPRPDLSGVWDVAYDDYLDVEVQVGERVHRTRLRRDGGRCEIAQGGKLISFAVDCTRSDLLCPHEIWPTVLTLTNRIGDLDDDGERLSISLAHEGEGTCLLGDESILEARLETLGGAPGSHLQAAALSLGRVKTVISGCCLGVQSAGRDVRIALSTGLSAVRR